MNYRIFINPGHCPNEDPGCVNRVFGVNEAEYVREIGIMLVEKLLNKGYVVKSLQTNNLRNGWDDDLNQPCIVNEANYWGADIAVSLHCNAFNGEAKGTECICFERDSEADRLARAIQNHLVTALNTTDRGIKYEEDKDRERRLSFCMLTDMPAVIVEPAFLDNLNDALILIDNKEEIAEAIFQGIVYYVEG